MLTIIFLWDVLSGPELLLETGKLLVLKKPQINHCTIRSNAYTGILLLISRPVFSLHELKFGQTNRFQGLSWSVVPYEVAWFFYCLARLCTLEFAQCGTLLGFQSGLSHITVRRLWMIKDVFQLLLSIRLSSALWIVSE